MRESHTIEEYSRIGRTRLRQAIALICLEHFDRFHLKRFNIQDALEITLVICGENDIVDVNCIPI